MFYNDRFIGECTECVVSLSDNNTEDICPLLLLMDKKTILMHLSQKIM